MQEGRGSADVLHLRDVPLPQLAEGRVLVRMRAASVNALDWHTTHGGLLLEIVHSLRRGEFGNLDEGFRGCAWLTASLLPLLERARGDAEQLGKALLRQGCRAVRTAIDRARGDDGRDRTDRLQRG